MGGRSPALGESVPPLRLRPRTLVMKATLRRMCDAPPRRLAGGGRQAYQGQRCERKATAIAVARARCTASSWASVMGSIDVQALRAELSNFAFGYV